MAHRTRAYRKRWVLLPALGFSLSGQAGAVATYYATRPEPVPKLTVRLAGEGEGVVHVIRVKD